MADIIYLAVPYSDKNEDVMNFRASVSDFIFSELSKEGYTVYAPISSCHHISKKYGLPRDYKFWKKMCEEFISIVNRVIVIALPGWEESVGVTAEIALAKARGLHVLILDPEPYLERMGNVYS